MMTNTAQEQVQINTAPATLTTIDEYRAERDRLVLLVEQQAEQTRVVQRRLRELRGQGAPGGEAEDAYRRQLTDLEVQTKQEIARERELSDRLSRVRGAIENFEQRYNELSRQLQMMEHDQRAAARRCTEVEERARRELEQVRREQEHLEQRVTDQRIRLNEVRPFPL